MNENGAAAVGFLSPWMVSGVRGISNISLNLTSVNNKA